MVRFGLWLGSHRWQAGITHPESRLSHHGETNKPGRRCPLLGLKRKWFGTALKSGFDPVQTLCALACEALMYPA